MHNTVCATNTEIAQFRSAFSFLSCQLNGTLLLCVYIHYRDSTTRHSAVSIFLNFPIIHVFKIWMEWRPTPTTMCCAVLCYVWLLSDRQWPLGGDVSCENRILRQWNAIATRPAFILWHLIWFMWITKIGIFFSHSKFNGAHHSNGKKYNEDAFVGHLGPHFYFVFLVL